MLHQWVKIKVIHFFPRPMRSPHLIKSVHSPHKARLYLHACSYSCSTMFNSIISNLSCSRFIIDFSLFLTTSRSCIATEFLDLLYDMQVIYFLWICISIIWTKMVTEKSRHNSLILVSAGFDLCKKPLSWCRKTLINISHSFGEFLSYILSIYFFCQKKNK